MKNNQNCFKKLFLSAASSRPFSRSCKFRSTISSFVEIWNFYQEHLYPSTQGLNFLFRASMWNHYEHSVSWDLCVSFHLYLVRIPLHKYQLWNKNQSCEQFQVYKLSSTRSSWRWSPCSTSCCSSCSSSSSSPSWDWSSSTAFSTRAASTP